MSVSVIYGDEPYVIDSKLKEIKKQIQCPELNLSYYDELTEDVVSSIEMTPFLDEKRVVILTLDEIKGSDELLQLVKSVPSTTEFVIIGNSIDKRSKLYKYFKSQNMLFECNKVQMNVFKKFVFRFLEQKNVKMTEPAYVLLCSALNYVECLDVNLYTVEIYLEQLVYGCSNNMITEIDIKNIISSNVSNSIFYLLDALVTNDVSKVFSLSLEYIERGENLIGILSLLVRSFRIAYKISLFKDLSDPEIEKNIGISMRHFANIRRFSSKVFTAVLDDLSSAINGIKSGKAESDALFLITMGKVNDLLFPETN